MSDSFQANRSPGCWLAVDCFVVLSNANYSIWPMVNAFRKIGLFQLTKTRTLDPVRCEYTTVQLLQKWHLIDSQETRCRVFAAQARHFARMHLKRAVAANLLRQIGLH